MPRVAFILPGLGRVRRGAETAFSQIARHLAQLPDMEVEAFGSGGQGLEGVTSHHVPCIPRERFERWPQIPCFRNECNYEELTFVLGLIFGRRYQPRRFDVAVACSYPYVNWYLQRTRRKNGPLQVFVTQNGDWMCQARNSEYRFFGCDGLVCFNPEYYQRNRERYHSVLIPNGVDPEEFRPAPQRTEDRLDDMPLLALIPRDRPVVLMVSALIASKRVAEGVRAVDQIPEAFLVVAGDGPEREAISRLAGELLPERHLLLGSIAGKYMPGLFRRADVFLHMSRIEPFGIVYLEAVATALPIVAPDLGVTRWILADTALYADVNDLRFTVNVLRRALNPEFGRPLGNAARRRVLADWTWNVQAGKYRDFIMQLVASRARADPPQGTARDLDQSRQLQQA